MEFKLNLDFLEDLTEDFNNQLERIFKNNSNPKE